MRWLTPAWLWAAAAIAAPLFLHLWSRGQARRVEVGSVGWLRPVEGLRGRRFRPSDPALFAVRAAFWALLALALALPRWSAPRAPIVAKTDWALVAPELAAAPAKTDVERAIEAFRARSGDRVETRWLATGFPRRPPSGASASGLWSWLVEADEAAPEEASFLVLAPLRLADLGGARPRLDRPVEIIEMAAAPSAALQSAAATERPPPAALTVRWSGDWSARGDELRFLRAGLDAATDAFQLDWVEEGAGSAGEPLGARIGSGAVLELVPPDASAATAPCLVPQLLALGGGEHEFRRIRCPAAAAESGAAAPGSELAIVGRDAFGRAWLTAWPGAGGAITWRSALTPALDTSDWAVSASWPGLLADLVGHAARREGLVSAALPDERRVDVRQALPAFAGEARGEETPAPARESAWPERALWLGVAALAVTERAMAARRTR